MIVTTSSQKIPKQQVNILCVIVSLKKKKYNKIMFKIYLNIYIYIKDLN